MATYVPNATQATEPVESRTVESAALEFRTLKGSVNGRVDALQADIDAEIADRLADAAALQAEVDAVEVRTLALEQLAFNGSTPGAVTVQRFACNGVQTVFVLAVTPVTVTAVDAYINGVYQNHDTFSVSGNTITFTEAPTAGAVLEMQLSVPLQLGVTTADAVEYTPAGTGAVATTMQSKLRESVSVFDFMTEAQIADVQSVSPTIDVTTALNVAAAAARTLGSGLVFPTVKSHYPISSTVDLSGIKTIDGKGALLKGTFSGAAAVIIGDVSGGSIWIEVQNTPDKSNVDGTIGIKVLGMNQSKCWVYARGFDDGIQFDGVSANRSWVGNEFNVIGLYNNGNHVHFNTAGSSYAVHNQFRGGIYYLGTNQIKNDRGTVKVTTAGTSLVSEIVFHDPEIGIDGGSRAADHGLFIHVKSGSTSTGNTVFFRNARLELYGSSAFVPYYVNIPNTTAGNFGVDVEAVAMPVSGCQLFIGDQKQHNVTLNYTGNSGTNPVIRQNSNIRPTFAYQVNGRVYVPERILYNASYTAPAQYITDAVGFNGPSRAIGDGKFLSQSTAVAIGTKWKKDVAGRSVFLKMSGYGQLVVICYDAAGNVLSGASPWYCVMRGIRSTSSGGVMVYQGLSDWVFIRPDVDSFFIGWSAWSGPDFYADLQFDVLMGPGLTRIRDDETGPNMIAESSSVQSYMQAGMALDAPTAVYRNELLLKTATTAPSTSGTNTITVANATGINTFCQLGVELDTVITGSERRYQHCSVTGVSGNTITISPSLTANVASGRKVLVNKWGVR